MTRGQRNSIEGMFVAFQQFILLNNCNPSTSSDISWLVGQANLTTEELNNDRLNGIVALGYGYKWVKFPTSKIDKMGTHKFKKQDLLSLIYVEIFPKYCIQEEF